MSVETALVPNEGGSLLVRLDRVRRVLAEARTLADVGAVLEDVERLKRYARAARWTLEQQNEIARVWFLAQRCGGVLWDASEKHRGFPDVVRYQNGTALPPTLAELGITKRQASHWKAFASVPEPAFEQIIDDIVEARRLTTSALLAHLDRGDQSPLRQVRLSAVEQGEAVVYETDYRALLAEIPDESVDLLLTDPPYSTDLEDVATFAAEWLALAVPKVKPSGRAYVCIGAYPGELAAYLGVLLEQRHLTLEQVLVWTYRNTLGPAPLGIYKLNWQAILYLRGPSAAPLECPQAVEQFSVIDLAAPDGRHGTRAHAWQKPDALAERLVRHAAPVGGVVLDPFTGTGTFLAAAARLHGRGIGAEIDPAMLTWCEQRGIEVVHAGG